MFNLEMLSNSAIFKILGSTIIKMNNSILKADIDKKLWLFDAIKDKRKILIVYHESDIDGHGVKIVTNYLNNILNPEVPMETFGCNIRADEAYEYIQNNKYDLIIVADLSFTKEFMKEKFDEISDKTIVLDHHESSLYMNAYKNCIVIPHDESARILSSGSFLFIYYVMKTLSLSTYDLIKLYNFTFITALYDTWFWNTEDTEMRDQLHFYYGDKPEDLALYFKAVGKNKYDNDVLNNLLEKTADEVFKSILNDEQMIVVNIKREMNISMCYKYYHNLKILKLENGQTIGFVFGLDDVSTIGNFILRANKELDYFMMIDLNTNKFSLRSRKDFNLVENIIKYTEDGGGHAQAAGFNLDKLSIIVDNIMKTYLSLINEKCDYTIESIKNISDFDEDTKTYKFR